MAKTPTKRRAGSAKQTMTPMPMRGRNARIRQRARPMTLKVSQYNYVVRIAVIGIQGITTAQMHGGVMQVSPLAWKMWSPELAEYCLHFHHVDV